MKILMVNKFHYIKGGSETYYFALKRLLESKGHEVVDFSMKDEKNFDSPYEKYFVENVDYANGGGAKEKARAAINIIYSREAKKKFEAIVKETKPDLIHLHIFQHQISPSILDIAKKYNIPTVYTAHDLKMICLNYKMMHHGVICEDCQGEKYYKCASNRCVKESFAKSCINVAEGYLHKFRKSYDAIDYVVTPSKFYRDKFIQFGVDEDRVIHIPNFLDKAAPDVNIKDDNEKYFLYFGRLSEEKGVFTLLKSVENTSMKLYIAGTGPLKEEIESYVAENKMDNVKVLGFVSGQDLTDLVANSKAVILPSEWYENGPYSAIESLQVKRPVIGADIGGIPELVDGNGYLFESKNVEKLKEVLEKMDSLTDEEYQATKNASYDLFEKNYVPAVHYEMLSKVYEKALAKHSVK